MHTNEELDNLLQISLERDELLKKVRWASSRSSKLTHMLGLVDADRATEIEAGAEAVAKRMDES